MKESSVAFAALPVSIAKKLSSSNAIDTPDGSNNRRTASINPADVHVPVLGGSHVDDGGAHEASLFLRFCLSLTRKNGSTSQAPCLIANSRLLAQTS